MIAEDVTRLRLSISGRPSPRVGVCIAVLGLLLTSCLPLGRAARRADRLPPLEGPQESGVEQPPSADAESGGSSGDLPWETLWALSDRNPVLRTTEPLTLQDLQLLARSKAPAVDRWRGLVAAADARERQARSLQFPNLRSDGQFLLLEDEVAFTDPVGGSIIVQDRRAYTQRTSLRYTAWDWGRVRSLAEARQQERVGTEAQRDRALEQLDLHVAQLFFAILRARADRSALDASVESLAGALTLARDLEAVGRANQADVLVVEANLSRRRFESRELGDLIRNLEEDVLRLLEFAQGSTLSLAEPPELAPTEGDAANGERARAPTDWEGIALARRAELRAIEARHLAFDKMRSSAFADYLPSLELFLEHEYSTTDSAFRDPDIFSGGVNVAWELLSAGRRRGVLDEYRALGEQARAEYREVVIEVRGDVRRALREVERARDGVEVARVVVRQASDNRDRVRDLFETGRATGQELLEAEALLLSEEARRNQARYRVHLARQLLRTACGLGVDAGPWGSGDVPAEP